MNRLVLEARVVLFKELLDILRDRRTLLRLLLPNLLVGPLMLLGFVALLTSEQQREDKKDVYFERLLAAPSLAEYVRAHGYTARQAPSDYEERLHDHSFSYPVISTPPAFERLMTLNVRVGVIIVNDTTNDNSTAEVVALQKLLREFARDRVAKTLQRSGINPDILDSPSVDDRDLSTPRARMGRILSIVPFVIAVALFVGAQSAALDATAGERERGSLEPLLMNPISCRSIVLGKWSAVFILSAAACLLSSLSFVPAQLLLPGAEVREIIHFGWKEALTLWLIQVPLAAAISAGLLALATRTQSLKEAQASTGLAWTAFSLLLMIPFFNGGVSSDWHQWVPGLAQSNLMNSVLRDGLVNVRATFCAAAGCVGLAAYSLFYVTRALQRTVRH